MREINIFADNNKGKC